MPENLTLRKNSENPEYELSWDWKWNEEYISLGLRVIFLVEQSGKPKIFVISVLK